MIVTELRVLNFVLITFLLLTTSNRVDGIAGRCYLCSQNTLAECAGSAQFDSPLYHTILQYYTEPCNGQCVLFRNENTSTIRGCSWTYGHMTTKSIGWHELSPGIRAYFCDSYLCNNGTFDQPEQTMIETASFQSPQQTLSPQELFIMGSNTLPEADQQQPPTNNVPRHLRQCYSCTARLSGCGEFLDPRYVSKYIRPCTSSCIIFRNPSDHNLITRDCSTTWPQVHAKSGLHKILGSDAFFCQESLCNGISFDFIMGIFHNRVPAVLTFPPLHSNEGSSTPIIRTTTVATTFPINIDDDDDSVIWEDPDLDFVIVEPPPPPSTTFIPTVVTFPPITTELPDDVDDVDELSTIPTDSLEHFEFIEGISASSTIAGGIAVAQQDPQFNWWDLDDVSFPPFTEPNLVPLTTTTITTTKTSPPLIPSTTKLTHIEEDDWSIFNTTTIPSISQPEIPVADPNSDIDFDMNDYFTFPTLFTTSTIDSNQNNTPPLVPYYFHDYKTKDQLAGLIKPVTNLAIPPFSWMLHFANENHTTRQSRQSLIDKTPTSTLLTKKKIKHKVEIKAKININLDHSYDYCHKKQCHNGGRLTSDCLCICLPAFSGNDCQIVHCDQEPAHICNFVLEDECKSDYVRYLCPKFCRMNICSSNKLS